jgi:alpha-ribazole phosphatase
MLIIARHGRTAANAGGLLQGRADHPLDDVGERQAARLAAALANITRVVASPLQRAQQTAGAFGLPVETDERWIEIDYGGLEGTRLGEVPDEVWQQWRTDPDYIPAGGESHRTLFERVTEAAMELLIDAAEQDIVVVSHVSPIKAVVTWIMALPPTSAARCYLDQASITRVSLGPLGPVLRSFNETQHLRDL